jgi:hyperosmotically inducible protein
MGTAWLPAAHAEFYSDAWITTKAKMALLTSDNVSGTAINVDTIDGRVTMHGKVATAAEKQQAETLARKIEGVKEVRNLLQVVPPAAEEKVEIADNDLKNRVEKALDDDKIIADSDINVQSVNNGVVLLSGKAKTLGDHLRAVECARAVPGVRKVTSEIESPDKVADAEVRKERAAGDAPSGDDGSMLGDAWITSAVKMRLLANGDTPALDINVDAQGGNVTLFGIVPTAAAKSAAEAEARKVNGVKNVRNDLQVVAKPAQDAVEVKDEDLTRKVNEVMDSREALKDADIDVEVKNGVVRLTGSVPSESLRLSAAIAARSVAGVKSVHDELRIAPPQG